MVPGVASNRPTVSRATETHAPGAPWRMAVRGRRGSAWAVLRNDILLMVSGDGMLRGVRRHEVASLASLIRVDADLTELASRIADL